MNTQKVLQTEATRRMVDDRIDVALAQHPGINTPERCRRFRTGYADRYYAFGRKSTDPDYVAGYQQCERDDTAQLTNAVQRLERRPHFARIIAESDPRFQADSPEPGQ